MIFLWDFKEPDSAVRHQQDNTKAVMNKKELGIGTLYITESLLSWKGPQGFSIEYPHISVHAYSKDSKIYPSECLYLMVENSMAAAAGNGEVENDDSDNESENDITELLFIPEDLTALPQMYEAIKQCQELHPDSLDATTDEDEAFEDMIEDGEEVDMEASGDGHGNLQNLRNLSIEEHPENGYGRGDNKQDMDEDQFEDAD